MQRPGRMVSRTFSSCVVASHMALRAMLSCFSASILIFMFFFVPFQTMIPLWAVFMFLRLLYLLFPLHHNSRVERAS